MKRKTGGDIVDALRRGEIPDAQQWELTDALRALADSLGRAKSGLPVEQARVLAKKLNGRVYFDLTRMLAQAWRDQRGFDPTLARHHAQALIDSGALDEAEGVLEDALTRAGKPGADAQTKGEIPEYEGLLGRLWKQRFVRSEDRNALARSIAHYEAQYESGNCTSIWHGINIVALLARQARDGNGDRNAALETARKVHERALQEYSEKPHDPWIAATLSEACLALGDCEKAELWLYRFLHNPALQPFWTGSYGRQLREIWQGNSAGDNSHCPSRLLKLLEQHKARTEGRWSVAPDEVHERMKLAKEDPAAFEKNFSGEGTFSLATARRMLSACSAVGCVANDKTGQRVGTGFLVSGEFLRKRYGKAPVFVTNAHVISPKRENTMRPDDARVTFEAEGAGGATTIYRVAEVLFTSNPAPKLGAKNAKDDFLDVTIVRLESLGAAACTLPVAEKLPEIDGKAKVFVVGHPRGENLQISLHDSLLLDIDADQRLLHYRTPTDPGSSGSPVFNAEFDLIGLHHGGSPNAPRLHGKGYYEANEGISILSIRRRLRR